MFLNSLYYSKIPKIFDFENDSTRAIKQNNISAAPQEVEDALNQTIQMFASRGQADLGNIDTQALRGRIAERLINEKALEFIEKSCVV